MYEFPWGVWLPACLWGRFLHVTSPVTFVMKLCPQHFQFPFYLWNVHAVRAVRCVCTSLSLIKNMWGVLLKAGWEKWAKIHGLTSDTEETATQVNTGLFPLFNSGRVRDKQRNKADCVWGTRGASCCLTHPWWWIMNEQDRSSYHLETVSWWMITGSIGSVFA